VSGGLLEGVLQVSLNARRKWPRRRWRARWD
jgi:hypothetical protein